MSLSHGAGVGLQSVNGPYGMFGGVLMHTQFCACMCRSTYQTAR